LSFCSTREQLANAVVWLAASLGQRPRIAKAVARLNGIDHGPKYRVTWRTVNLMFERIRAIEDAMIVPGTTSAEEASNLLFARVRRIENLVEQLAAAAPTAEAAGEAGIDYERLADKVAERLAGKPAE
jgi:hypothetical protein